MNPEDGMLTLEQYMAACLAHKQRVRRAMAAAHTAQDELLEMMDGDALPADPAALERYARAQFPGAWELVARTDVAPPAAKRLEKYMARFGGREPRIEDAFVQLH